MTMKEFIVVGRTNLLTRQHKPYAQLKLAAEDETFNISVWDLAPEMPPQMGQLVKLSHIKDFNGNKSCSITDLIVGLMADDRHPLYNMMQRPISREIWDKTINQLVTYCDDDKLIGIIKSFAEKLYKPYSEYPAAASVHHAFPGGLLNHVWQMLHMLEGLFPCLPYQIKPERCILAIMFHDYGKVYEYAKSGDPQQDMYLLGHIYIGAHKLQNILEQHDIDSDEIKRIIHIILSHHGQREWGSPIVPCTQEAAIVHYLDNISAKVETMESAPEGEYIYSLGTNVVK